MATYKQIKGVTVQTLDSDPVLNVNSWSSGGSMNTDRARGAGDGIQTAFITFGGTTPSPGSQLTNTETYDGTSFTEVADLNTGRTDLAGAGTTTASLAATGSAGTGIGTFVESWNGSSWTETTENNTARYQLAGFGIQTAMVIAGGLAPPFSALTEYWNGSSWTEVNDLNTARQGLNESGTGVYTAGMVAGGRKAHPSNPGQEAADTETWNATSWTEVGDLNEAKQLGGLFGTSTSAIYAGGADTATLAAVESWDGSSWSETSDLATARYYVSSGGASGTSGIISGGAPGAATEEWSLPPPTSAILTEGDIFLSGGQTLKGFGRAAGIPAATFASGGNLNVAKNAAAGAGTQTAGMFTGGRLGPPSNLGVNQNEQYNGSSWTEVNNLNTARYGLGGANSGSQTAALVFAGYTDSPAGDKAVTESWDGSSWTEVNDLNTAGSNGAGFGKQGSAIYCGGDSRGYNKTESWNGSSWTETTDLNTNRAQMSGFGISTAGLIAGGDLYPVTSPTRLSVQTELWDGSSWTEVNDLNTGRRRMGNGGFGTQTSGLVAGGYTTTYVANTESWNGTSWTERTEIQTRDITTGVGGGAALGFIAGGGTSPGAMSNATEEWTADATLSTVTVS